MDDTLGRYRLDSCIGRGGMAEVWKATAKGPVGFSKTVAIKRIHPHLIDASGAFEAFASEARLAAKLDHPNVVQVFDFDFAQMPDGQPGGFIAMEFVDGINLSGVLKLASRLGEPLTTEVIAYIGAQAAAGLAYAHTETDEKGKPLEIVHRDISPQNILISRRGEVKITDFGIAKFADAASKTDPGIVKGKVSYMAPEQIHQRPIDARSDVFALGLVLYQMLAGDRLFQGASLADLVQRVSTYQGLTVAELQRVPPRVQSIVRRALEPNPADRFQSAAEIEVELSAILGGRGPQTRDALADLVNRCVGPLEGKTSVAIEDEDLPPTRVTSPSLASANLKDELPLPPPAATEVGVVHEQVTPPAETPAPAPPRPTTRRPWLWLVLAGTSVALLGGLGFILTEFLPSQTDVAAGSTTRRGFFRSLPHQKTPDPTSVTTPTRAVEPASTATPKATRLPRRTGGGKTKGRTRKDPVPVDIRVLDETGRQVAPLNIELCGHHVYTRTGRYFDKMLIQSEYFDTGCEVRVHSGETLLARRKVLPRTTGPIELAIRVRVDRPRPAPKPVADAYLRLSSKPEGAIVKLNGKQVGETGGVVVVAVPAGDHEISFRSGAKFVSRKISVRSKQTLAVDADLRRKKIKVK